MLTLLILCISSPMVLRGILSSVTVTDQQVEFLVKKKHIYLPKTSRINFTCINARNIDYITQSIHEAVMLTEG
jgi:aspartate/tyrosine/aromatic aminotransferase